MAEQRIHRFAELARLIAEETARGEISERADKGCRHPGWAGKPPLRMRRQRKRDLWAADMRRRNAAIIGHRVRAIAHLVRARQVLAEKRVRKSEVTS